MVVGTNHPRTVKVGGELDIAAVPALDARLRAAERDASLVVLDLQSLEFVDSSGASLILAANRRIRQAGGRLAVMRGPVDVQWLLALLGVDRELEFVERSFDGT
jgi:anti-sigma B factor antagonist